MSFGKYKNKAAGEVEFRLRSLLDEVELKLAAFEEIESRAKDAHEYCQKYLMPKAWGKNIWHEILDDAIRMRMEKENAGHDQC